ncbi:MAG: insulinase family protein [Acidobacteria bacterium]|nr:insulinase family protein [Acidobacteriota bacterium]MBK8813902.1 insulinase family protein [Acidobacteriota bacterium]
MKESIQKTTFPNGLTILTDRMPDVRSVTVGFFYKIGARHEPAELSGISHFIEHAVFKGTNKRSALEIAVESDRLGGSFDAFTMHEETGFAMKVVDRELPTAFELLADLLTDPRFDERELKREQRVIIEEIKMTEDSPEEYLHEIFNEKLFPQHPLGRSIAGTPRTVRSFNSEVTRRYHKEHFGPENLVIAAAGNVEHRQIRDLAGKSFGQQTGEIGNPKSEIPNPTAPIVIKKEKGLEQAHLIISTPYVSARSEHRYAADILANALGGGTSSRLWQKIREEKGLAYSVGASAAMYQDCGVFTIFAGVSPRQTEKVLDIALSELRSVVRDGITAAELELMKAQTVASILLGLEDSANRAATLARLEMVHGRQISIEETLQKIEAVTREEVQALAAEFFQTEKIGFGALGNVNGLKINRQRLAI